MLTSVHIKNFRSCKDVKIENMGPMLGLVGRNGAGKTTILRAIEWAASTALSRGLSTAFAKVDRADALANPQSQIELEIDENEYRYTLGRIWDDHIHIMSARDEESLATRTRGSAQWNVLLTRSKDAVVLIDRGQSIEINDATAMMPALASLLPEGDPLQIHLRRVLKVLGSVRYYLGYGIFEPAYRPTGEPEGPVPQSNYEEWAKAHQETGALPSMVLRLIRAHLTEPDVFAEVKDRLGPDGLGLLGDIRVITLGDVGAVNRGRSYYDVVFEPVGQKIELSLGQISGGTRQVLYLLLALLLDQSSTMLVEQPEDGIHPALLAKLVDLFRVNVDPAQIILASHSPTVLSSLRPEDVRMVEIRAGATRVRGLTGAEVHRAGAYMQRDGTLAEFLELIQED